MQLRGRSASSPPSAVRRQSVVELLFVYQTSVFTVYTTPLYYSTTTTTTQRSLVATLHSLLYDSLILTLSENSFITLAVATP